MTTFQHHSTTPCVRVEEISWHHRLTYEQWQKVSGGNREAWVCRCHRWRKPVVKAPEAVVARRTHTRPEPRAPQVDGNVCQDVAVAPKEPAVPSGDTKTTDMMFGWRLNDIVMMCACGCQQWGVGVHKNFTWCWHDVGMLFAFTCCVHDVVMMLKIIFWEFDFFLDTWHVVVGTGCDKLLRPMARRSMRIEQAWNP